MSLRTAAAASPARRWLPPLVALVAAAAVWLIGRSHPANGRLPRCPSAAAFGIHCPGCGGQRAVHALANGRPAEAWRLNPAAVAGLPAAAFWFAAWAAPVYGRPVRTPRVPAAAWWAAAAAAACLTVVRNVPDWNAAAGFADLSAGAGYSRTPSNSGVDM